MACRVDVCEVCGGDGRGECCCAGGYQAARQRALRAARFDYEGALCDVLTLIAKRCPATLKLVDVETKAKWLEHRKAER